MGAPFLFPHQIQFIGLVYQACEVFYAEFGV